MYKKTGTIQFFEDLTLADAEWQIAGVTYDWINNIASVEVWISDDGWVNTNSRTYTFQCQTEWSAADAVNAIMGLDQFANSALATN